jgi:3-hydroxyisobutyrate dehydrogenase-like beta-hydroxyacid dehydrogenase
LKSIAVLDNGLMGRGFATHLLAQGQPVRVWKRKPEMAWRRVEHPGLFEELSKRWVNSLGPWFEPS